MRVEMLDEIRNIVNSVVAEKFDEVLGMTIYTSDRVPDTEIWIVEYGNVVAKIVNIAAPDPSARADEARQ